MCEQVWDNADVQAADKEFNKALERVRGERVRIELLAAFEAAVTVAADA